MFQKNGRAESFIKSVLLKEVEERQFLENFLNSYLRKGFRNIFFVYIKRMTYTEKSKNNTYEWRKKNKERLLELHRGYEKIKYEKNKEYIKQRNLARYYCKKEVATLMMILVDDM